MHRLDIEEADAVGGTIRAGEDRIRALLRKAHAGGTASLAPVGRYVADVYEA